MLSNKPRRDDEVAGRASLFGKVPDGKKTLALFIISNLVNVFMLTVTIPQVVQYSGGLKPFDLMTSGYDVDYARAFLTNLGDEGRGYYLSHHLALDMIYPALYGLGGAAVWLWLLSKTPFRRDIFGWIGVLPLISSGADYIENGLIITLLLRFPEIPEIVTLLSSIATTFKSSTMLVFISLLVFLLLAIGVRKLLFRQS